MSRMSFVALAGFFCLGLVLTNVDSLAAAESGLTLEEAIATGYCDHGDLPCLQELMAVDDDSSSDDKSSKDDDSKSDDKSSDDKSSKDDDSKSDDKSSDDKSSKDDDSKSDDKSSDDKSSKDDDSQSDDKSSDDKSSKDDDSRSDDKSSDDDSSSDGSGEPLPGLTPLGTQVTEFNNVTVVPATVTVSLSAASPVAVTVMWATENGTALAGDDYLAANGQLNFAPGQLVATLELSVIGDDTVEPTESFFLRLLNPVGADLAVERAEIIILDDDIDEE